MSTTNIHAAKTSLSRLVDAALRGEDVIIAKAGKPVVRLTPIAPQDQREKRRAFFGCLKGQFAFDTAAWGEADKDVEVLFNEGAIFPAERSRK